MKYNLLYAFIVITHLLSGQTTLKGLLVTVENQPAFANISLYSGSDSSLVKKTWTDEKGAFEFRKVSTGNYFIEIHSFGYSPYTEIIPTSAFANAEYQLNRIQLNPIVLDDVEVAVSASDFIQQREGKLVFVVDSFYHGRNAPEIIGEIPGMQIDHKGDITLYGEKRVTVYINGRKSILSKDALQVLIENLSAEQIKEIELETVRGVEREAGDNGTIINIITNEWLIKGFYGSVGGNAYRGNKISKGLNTSLNYTNSRFSASTNIAYKGHSRDYELEAERKITGSENGNRSLDLITNNASLKHVSSASMSLIYKLNDQHKIGSLMAYSYIGSDNPRNSLTDIHDDWGTTSYDTESNGKISSPKIGANVFHSFKSKNWSVNTDADYSLITRRYTLDFNSLIKSVNDQQDAISSSLEGVSLSDYTVNIGSVKSDVRWNIQPSTVIKFGAKHSFSTTDLYLAMNFDNDITRFKGGYNEQVSAAYVGISSKKGDFSYQAGLRSEYTHATLWENQQADRYQRYNNLFPNATVSWKKGNNSLDLKYQRGIGRPSYNSLNRSLTVIDPYLRTSGNGELTPFYENTYELSYGFKNTYYLSLNFYQAEDYIMQVLHQDSSGVVTQIGKNLDRFTDKYLNLYVPIKIGKRFKFVNNLMVAYFDFSSQLFEYDLKNASMKVNYSGRMSYNGQKGYNHAMSVVVTGRGPSGIYYRSRPSYRVNYSVNKLFFNKKLRVALGMQDIFRSYWFYNKIDFGNQDALYIQYPDTQQAYITLSYRFNKGKNWRAEKRKFGNESETKRFNR